jgi:hypothetical protein
MTARELLATLRARGVEVRTDGRRIGCIPKGAVTAEEREQIRRCKRDLVALLTSPQADQVEAGQAPSVRGEISDEQFAQRVEAFEAQLAEWTAAGRTGAGRWTVPVVPVLALPGVIPTAGGCVSCGVALAAPEGWRCATCLAALYLALGMDGEE